MKKTVVLYPGLAVGHFVPMMQLADVLLEEGYAVVVALIDITMEQNIPFAAAVDRVTASKPSVTFHTLPRIHNPPTVTNDVQLLLGFFTSNASTLAVFLQLPWVRTESQPSFKELGDATLNLHGVPPMPASHLIEEMLEDPESEIYKAMTNSLSKNLEADGILVNTFTSLEARAVEALTDPQFLPKRAGNHSEVQLKEIAVGLERSGHRFLWVVRAPLGDNPEKAFGVHADPDLHTLLPEGFLERTKGLGLVVKLWAPQVDVLRHKAIGAFMTHCGWNSILEGTMAGVPMLCWPLYAEQKMNRVFMVEEAEIGLEVVGWQEGLVKAEEVEAKVRLVLDSKEGEKIRARVTAHKEAAAMAWKNGGSSRTAFGKFLLDAGNLGKELRHASLVGY
ncbi:unnamed protein product [Urochloa decumbens]|uniref:Glycosyltransferase n=1 Tax=Urochloa decumbens TaxID=240449 RepID=A0ABC9GL92_9POAL